MNKNIKKKKHILIVSCAFAPLNRSGAVRLTKIAKYFDKKKWKVSVLTTKSGEYVYPKDTILQKDVENSDISVYRTFCFDVYFIKGLLYGIQRDNNSSNQEKENIRSRKPREFKQLGKIVRRCFYPGNISWYISAKKFIEQNLNLDGINLMLTSFSSIASHQLGYFIKKRKPNIFWIADFRDPYMGNAGKKGNVWERLQRIHARKTEQRILNSADKIITVSEGLKRSFDEKLGGKGSAIVIYNGYDKEDVAGKANFSGNKKRFTISYLGKLYGNLRNPALLFDVLEELLKEGAIEKEKLLVNYAGSDSSVMKKYVEKFNIGEIYHDCSFVSREKSLQIQSNSHLLLLLSLNSSESRGILTSKLYEYINVRRQIICLMTGEGTGELGKLIKDGDLGIACSYKHYAESKKKLRKFILKKYREYMHTGKIEYRIDNRFISRFNYENIVDQIINIYETTK